MAAAGSAHCRHASPRPPSTAITCPVTHSEAGSASDTIHRAYIIRIAAPLQRYLLALLLLDGRSLFRCEPHHARQRARFSRPRCDGVDTHAMRGEFQRPAASEVLQCRLAGGVMRQSGNRLVTVRARYIDDRSLRQRQMGKRRRGEQAWAKHVHGKDLHDPIGRGVRQRRMAPRRHCSPAHPGGPMCRPPSPWYAQHRRARPHPRPGRQYWGGRRPSLRGAPRGER